MQQWGFFLEQMFIGLCQIMAGKLCIVPVQSIQHWCGFWPSGTVGW